MTVEDSLTQVEVNAGLTSSTEIIRVLHIDDEEDQQMFLKVFVEGDPSIKVTSAQSAELTIELVQTGAYDCLVSDYDMPNMDGITLAKKIRETSNIPIIIYTGRGSEEVAERAFAAGVDDYIRKENAPAHYQVLSKCIRQAVERRRSNESYRNLFESASDSIILHSLDGKILDINEAGCRNFGYSIGELLGKILYDYVTPNGISHEGNFEKIINQGREVFESTIKSKDGSLIPVEVSNKVIKYMGNDAILSFSRDISDRKRLESQMKERLEALQSHALELAKCEDVKEIAKTTYKILHDVMDYSFFGLGVVEEDKLRFIPETFANKDRDLEHPINGPSICARAIRNGAVENVPDVRLDRDYNGPKSGYKYLSELAVPIKIGDKVAAVLNVEDERLGRFTRDDERLLKLFSEHIASSIQRIKLLESAKKSLSKIEALNSHAIRIATLDTVDEVAEYSFKVLEEVLGFGDGCIGVVEGDVIEFRYARNLAFQIPNRPLNGRGITARACRTGESQLVSDTRLDPDFVKDVDPAEYLSELDVPVKVDGRVVAVVDLEDKRLGFFTEEDREIVEILAENISSAMKRIELLKSVSQFRVRLEALHRHAADLSTRAGAVLLVFAAFMLIFGHGMGDWHFQFVGFLGILAFIALIILGFTDGKLVLHS